VRLVMFLKMLSMSSWSVVNIILSGTSYKTRYMN